MDLFARALRDLGGLARGERHGGSFAHAVAAAGAQRGAARRVARGDAPVPRRVAAMRTSRVPIYKRAQLTAADLAAAFGGPLLGAFSDLSELTIFADNLVPHVLRREGVLAYDADLAARIDREELLPAGGSPEEVEIRAVALHAVELLVAARGDDDRDRGRQRALEPRRAAALQGAARATARARRRTRPARAVGSPANVNGGR